MIVNIPTKICFGEEHLKDLANEYKKDKILIVTTKSKKVTLTSTFEKLVDSLKKNKTEYLIISNVTGNPTSEEVDEGIKVCTDNKCTAIIAVGGGSTIDVAKTIAFGATNPDYWSYFENPKQYSNKPLKISVINTSSGTGSEINCFAVITQKNKKMGLYSEMLYPDMTIIIPKLMCSLPYKNTFFQLLDCLFHAVESYLSINSNGFSVCCAETCIRVCLKNLLLIKNNLENEKFREELAIASLFSACSDMYGGCLSIHSLGHAICAYHDNILHGEGIAIIATKYYENLEKLANINLKTKFKELSKIFEVYFGQKEMFSEYFEEIFSKFYEGDLCFKSYNIKKSEFGKLIKNARDYVGELFDNDPIEITNEMCMKIFEESYDKEI